MNEDFSLEELLRQLNSSVAKPKVTKICQEILNLNTQLQKIGK